MAKTLSQGRKPGSGRKPGKGKTLRNGRKPGSGRRRRDGDGSPSPPQQQPQPQPQRTINTGNTHGKTTAAAAVAADADASASASTSADETTANSSSATSAKSQVSSRDLEAIDALRELNNSPPEPLTPTLTPTQPKGRHTEVVQSHTNEGPFVTHTRLLSNPSASSNLNSSAAWNSLAHPQPVNGLVGMHPIGLGDTSTQQDQNSTHSHPSSQSKEGPNGLLIRSYI
ncbi:hypothetical protein ZYGR_0AZ01310 [Zygosaccharomyces rouxii]|uniref:Uncharacterized protein n=1 Tax=Zygosaccharomyces rouxii TaxID=4956 RepID=A0A1Q3AJP2_ZYGRO|nr:hypothetical protein ZYGR_0AZ01310 [Zygosaccharomyces rouxii]